MEGRVAGFWREDGGEEQDGDNGEEEAVGEVGVERGDEHVRLLWVGNRSVT
jgi:hypothetical protein